MIRGLVGALALLYCFVWLRIPEVAGVALPAQRLVAWACGGALAAHVLLKGPLRVGPRARDFVRLVALFLVSLGVNLVQHVAYGSHFRPLYFVMDLSKYLASFTVAFAVYYVLAHRLLDRDRLVRGIVVSGVAATIAVYLLLALYFAGFRTHNEIFAASFGGALGVWPTGGGLPRLAGTGAEPQQFSVLLLTPLLLMLTRERIARYWPVALAGLAALLLSQSKFAVVSLAITGGFLFLVYEKRRRLLLAAAALAAPVAVVLLLRLPTFQSLVTQGTEAGAIVERLENLVLMLDIIRNHAVFGIGAGQYGVYRGILVYGNPNYAPGYTPNMDFLKVFAETGIVGFLVLLFLMASLFRLFLRGLRTIPPARRGEYLALLCGAAAIVLNMLIGYELLHVFFWINVGLLIHAAESVRHAAAPRPPRAAAAAGAGG